MMGSVAQTGARGGVLSPFRRLVAAAMARDLQVFVLPGPDVARAHGLDFAKAGMRLAVTPRHAGVLLIVGSLPKGLRNAASIIYAQMPRPRVILSLGAVDLVPLPGADATAELSQSGLIAGMAELRRIVAAGAFGGEVEDFSPPVLETKIQYTCPMHPEVISDEPGNCPKCGMDLVAREASAGGGHAGHTPYESEVTMPNHKTPAQPHSADDHAKHTASEKVQYTCPMHPEVVSDEPGSCPKCGMFLVPVEEKSDEGHSGHGHGDHGKHAGAKAAQYICPMHPEVVSDEPGSCPKCGMFLVPVEDKDAEDHSGHGAHSGHGGHDAHAGHGMAEVVDGIEPQFMSMVDLTKGQPRSSDGLQMEWIEVPFGPFFPGLPGGLELDLTLDGDTVVSADARSAVAAGVELVPEPLSPEEFVDRLSGLMPLARLAYRNLAVSALENSAKVSPDASVLRGRVGALERERIASHLSWLSDFGAQAGFGWLASRAARLQLQVRDADVAGIAALVPDISVLLRRAGSAPSMRMRLAGMARLDPAEGAAGPVARAQGQTEDARSGDATYDALGFAPQSGEGSDALARFKQRCDEIGQSLQLIAAAAAIVPPRLDGFAGQSGEGEAICETPRGLSRLWLRMEDGKIVQAKLATPSATNLALVEKLTDQQELGDALVAVASLDISPWEIAAQSGAELHP